MDRKKLAVIHIVKKELGLSDKEYRDILEKAAGVRSSKDLTESGFKKLMGFFVRSSYYQRTDRGLTIKQKLYIQYLVRDLGWDKGHLENFIRKFYHKQDIDELSKKDATKVIVALRRIQANKQPEASD